MATAWGMIASIVLAAAVYEITIWYAVKGLWALALWKLNRNIRRRERASLHQEEVPHAR